MQDNLESWIKWIILFPVACFFVELARSFCHFDCFCEGVPKPQTSFVFFTFFTIWLHMIFAFVAALFAGF